MPDEIEGSDQRGCLGIMEARYAVIDLSGIMDSLGIGPEHRDSCSIESSADRVSENSAGLHHDLDALGAAPPSGATTVGHGYLPDARIQLFATGKDGKAYSSWKQTPDPNAGWTDWISF
ncbi:hypothetical protein [Enhygromyxa salina]|nr:hypothetical protein [Enhygromyxa salina]